MEPFIYRARLVRVIDGDTIQVILDVGFGLHLGEDTRLPLTLRLLHVNARELHSDQKDLAQADKKLVAEWMNNHTNSPWPLLIRTTKDDAFGRYLAEVYSDNESLNDYLLARGVPRYV